MYCDHSTSSSLLIAQLPPVSPTCKKIPNIIVMNNKLLLVLYAVTLVCWCKIWLHFLCYSFATSSQITSSLSALSCERHAMRARTDHEQLSLLSTDE